MSYGGCKFSGLQEVKAEHHQGSALQTPSLSGFKVARAWFTHKQHTFHVSYSRVYAKVEEILRGTAIHETVQSSLTDGENESPKRGKCGALIEFDG